MPFACREPPCPRARGRGLCAGVQHRQRGLLGAFPISLRRRVRSVSCRPPGESTFLYRVPPASFQHFETLSFLILGFPVQFGERVLLIVIFCY